jgi:hypothetical protein
MRSGNISIITRLHLMARSLREVLASGVGDTTTPGAGRWQPGAALIDSRLSRRCGPEIALRQDPSENVSGLVTDHKALSNCPPSP